MVAAMAPVSTPTNQSLDLADRSPAKRLNRLLGSRGLESMNSLNFEFLRPTWKELALLGGFAEQYAGPDPASAAVKLRSFAEQVVELIWKIVRLPRPPFQANLHEKLNFDPLQTAVPAVVISKLHALRIPRKQLAGSYARHTNWAVGFSSPMPEGRRTNAPPSPSQAPIKMSQHLVFNARKRLF